jgi:hypothetical protein
MKTCVIGGAARRARVGAAVLPLVQRDGDDDVTCRCRLCLDATAAPRPRSRSPLICCESRRRATEARASRAQCGRLPAGVGASAPSGREWPAQMTCRSRATAGCGRTASIRGAPRALPDPVLRPRHGASRMSAAGASLSGPGASESGVSRTRPRTPGEGPDRATRSSPRRACRRCARTRSLEDLRGAIAALEAHLVSARGAVGALAEVDEEAGVELHPAPGQAVHP